MTERGVINKKDIVTVYCQWRMLLANVPLIYAALFHMLFLFNKRKFLKTNYTTVTVTSHQSL